MTTPTDAAAHLIKIRFGPAETGWALEVPSTRLAIVNNVTVGDELHFGDVVRLRAAIDGIPEVEEVLLRQYPQQVVVRYPEDDDTGLTKLAAALRSHGCIAEGAVPGMLMVAAPLNVDAKAIAKALGYAQD